VAAWFERQRGGRLTLRVEAPFRGTANVSHGESRFEERRGAMTHALVAGEHTSGETDFIPHLRPPHRLLTGSRRRDAR
jgi:hypothetical protein